jgi:hypothetical protein
MTTKRDLVNQWIRERVDRAINSVVAERVRAGCTCDAKLIADRRHEIGIMVSSECTGTYDFLELEDIMAWRKRKVGP